MYKNCIIVHSTVINWRVYETHNETFDTYVNIINHAINAWYILYIPDE